MSSGTENGCGCLSLVDCAYACLTHVGLQDQRAQGDKQGNVPNGRGAGIKIAVL